MISYVDRESKQTLTEKVYGENSIRLLYNTPIAKWIYPVFPFVSRLYGWLQKRSSSKKKVLPFIKDYGVDATEFLDSPGSYPSFNAFFIRKLKATARPISSCEAVMPADGRYFFFSPISSQDRFYVKGQKLNLAALFGNSALAKRYEEGVMIFSRLCPVDYHRFHFPIDAEVVSTQLINGPLWSVNPLALKQNIDILSENKRLLVHLRSEIFGDVYMIPVGATSVGSIVMTCERGKKYQKGDEMGYFSFGGSSLILLFPPNALRLAPDLPLAADLEVLCKMGTSLGFKA